MFSLGENGEKRVFWVVFYLCSNDEGNSEDSQVVDFPHPCGRIVPISEAETRGKPSPHTHLFMRREGRGPACSGPYPSGFQCSGPCWVKTPCPKAAHRPPCKGRQAGIPQGFQRPGLWLKGSGPQLLVPGFLKINTLTSIFRAHPVNQPLCMISEGIAHFCAHCCLHLHQL